MSLAFCLLILAVTSLKVKRIFFGKSNFLLISEDIQFCEDFTLEQIYGEKIVGKCTCCRLFWALILPTQGYSKLTKIYFDLDLRKIRMPQ